MRTFRLPVIFTASLAACALLASQSPSARAQSTPPATWKEHWFEHNQVLKRVAYNDEVALYFDKDVRKEGTEWILPFMTKLWRYTKKTYGKFGNKPENARLYCVLHEGKYSGGHPSTYFDESHDFRNVADCGPGPWGSPAYDIPSHEVGHIVEGASNGVQGSPAFGIWHDSKWAEFYQYDVYYALGMKQDAQRLFDKFTQQSDDFPRPGSHWFRDWFYPLWRDHGHAQVMVRYFALLTKYYPKKNENGHKTYSRDMNWGEYLHFMSGAAKTNLKPLASQAFGWTPEMESQYQQAKKEFPAVKY